MGLVGLVAGRLLQIPMVGVYHTNLPEYVGHLTGDPALENLAWKYMNFFYGSMDRIQVPSEAVKRHLTARGFCPEKLVVVGRGVDLRRFSPTKRHLLRWDKYGLDGLFKFLYVGRISREKDLWKLWDLDLASRRAAPRCTECDWECFRDPSELFGPVIDALAYPLRLLRRFRRDPEYFRLWREDVRYYLACDVFDGRRPLSMSRLAKFAKGGGGPSRSSDRRVRPFSGGRRLRS
jgi:hypothetical protein